MSRLNWTWAHCFLPTQRLSCFPLPTLFYLCVTCSLISHPDLPCVFVLASPEVWLHFGGMRGVSCLLITLGYFWEALNKCNLLHGFRSWWLWSHKHSIALLAVTQDIAPIWYQLDPLKPMERFLLVSKKGFGSGFGQDGPVICLPENSIVKSCSPARSFAKPWSEHTLL